MVDAADVLGDTTLDVYLNGEAFWRNVPVAIWDYRLGGYQVLKKWLSYREQKVLGRRLRAEEVQHFADAARRIGAAACCPSSRGGEGDSVGRSGEIVGPSIQECNANLTNCNVYMTFRGDTAAVHVPHAPWMCTESVGSAIPKGVRWRCTKGG